MKYFTLLDFNESLQGSAQMRSLICFLTFFVGLLTAGYECDLAVCAIFRDEAPYLKEWIEFHRLVGVERFYLYNNLSQDDYQKVLTPYVKRGIVQLIDWSQDYADVGTWSGIQNGAYDDCLRLTKGKVRWLAFLDIDEFLFPARGNNLREFLKPYRHFGGVGVNWQLFGTGRIGKIPEGKLLIETLLYRGETNFPDNIHIKSIVQPEKVHRSLSPHHCLYLNGHYQVDSNKTRFEGPYAPSVLVDKIRINHYWSRDEAYFLEKKVPRRAAWHESADGVMTRNEAISKIYDDTILRFVPRLKKLMGMDKGQKDNKDS